MSKRFGKVWEGHYGIETVLDRSAPGGSPSLFAWLRVPEPGFGGRQKASRTPRSGACAAPLLPSALTASGSGNLEPPYAPLC